MYNVDVAAIREARAASGHSIWLRVSRTVLILGAVSCFTDISSEMVASVLPIYVLVHLQLSPLQFGVVDGLYQGVTALARLASGVLADRSGRHKIAAVAGYGLSALCKLGLLAASGPAALVALISVDRTGKGVRTAPRDAMISRAVEASDRAAAFGVHRALDTAGVVIGPLVAFLLLRAVPDGFDAVFVVSFATALVGLAVLVLFVNDEPRTPESRVRTPGRFADAARGAPFRTIVAVGSLLNVTVMSDAFLYLILQRRGGFAAETLPLFYIATSLVFLALAVPVGRLADRLGRARVYLGGHLLAVVMYAIPLVTDVSLPIMAACFVLHGAYYAATDGVLAALVSGTLPADVLASGLGGVGTGTSLARLCGSMLIGALWAWRGPEAVLVCCLALTAFVIVGTGRRLLRLDHVHQEAGRA